MPTKQNNSRTRNSTSRSGTTQKKAAARNSVSRQKSENTQQSEVTVKNVAVSSEKKDGAVLCQLDKIVTAATQPRRYFDPDAMQSLIDSVKKDGILQPLLVRPIANDKYELVAGERRYRAAQKCSLLEIPVVLREMTDTEALEYALAENLQRQDLNAVEETEGILDLLALKLSTDREGVIALLNKLSKIKRNIAYDDVRPEDKEVIKSVFISVGKISPESFRIHRLPLLKLPPEILEALRAGDIAYSKALLIAKVKDDTERGALLEETISQNLSVSQIKNKISAQTPSGNELTNRISVVSKLAKKSSAWENPETRSKLQDLLAQVEKLLGEEE